MRAIMLAAGDGGRLGRRTASLPKPLVTLDGRPLIDYTLSALAGAGVEEVVVVIGYRGQQIEQALARRPASRLRIRTIENPRYTGDASLSLQAARKATGGEPFLLVMADHVFSGDLLAGLARTSLATPELSHVAADRGAHSPEYIEEATKLALDPEGLVTGIGKAIDPWHALDAGAFYLTRDVWEAAAAGPEDCELSVIFRTLAAARRLRAADITGSFWYDIDTEGDLAGAAALLKSRLATPEDSSIG
ncbi:MAG: NTP transferase domain-containing protein [Dehalococcoidia bacterium]